MGKARAPVLFILVQAQSPTLLSGAEPALELLPDFLSNRAAVLLSNLA